MHISATGVGRVKVCVLLGCNEGIAESRVKVAQASLTVHFLTFRSVRFAQSQHSAMGRHITKEFHSL